MNIKIEIRRYSFIKSNIMQIVAILFLSLFATFNDLNAQEPFPPPLQIQVYNIQGLSFGDFYPGPTGGTVSISETGARSSIGVVLSGGDFFPAIFIVELLPNRNVTVGLGGPVTLTRVGGTETMTIDPLNCDKCPSFVTSGGHPFHNPVQVGGTLTVGDINANPAGEYSGFFNVTFIQE